MRIGPKIKLEIFSSNSSSSHIPYTSDVEGKMILLLYFTQYRTTLRFYSKSISKTPISESCLIGEFIIPRLVIAYDNVLKQFEVIRWRNKEEDFLEPPKFLRPALASTPSFIPLDNLDFRDPEILIEPQDHEFADQVDFLVDQISKGECIQTVISRKMSLKIPDFPIFKIYRMLRRINPSPYMFYLQFGSNKLLGASPETFLRFSKDEAILKPIAGTRKRGKNEADDLALEKELLSDPKEMAEHLMLIDLARNDLSRVCQFGSVKTRKEFLIERYSHVMHIVSEVYGKPMENIDVFDAIWASFPAGTLSGAPKVRAMQFIHEIERSARGPYGGVVGYIDFSGNSDSCITIRSLWTQSDRLEFQAGAGIVYDSQAKLEVKETWNKAKSVLRAIGLSQSIEEIKKD